MMNRTQASSWVSEKIPDQNLRRHMLAVGVALEKLASHFNEDPETWFLTGILHDIDLSETTDPAIHGALGAGWLQERGFSTQICNAVRAHAGHAAPDSTLATALIATDQMTGLIIACALIKEKKLANVSVDTILKRFKEKRFAAGADRSSIMQCEKLGLDLKAFSGIILSAMQGVSSELGL